MELAALPGNATENGPPSCSQASMRIAGDQAHTAQPALDQALEKLAPVQFLLTQRDRQAQDLPFSV